MSSDDYQVQNIYRYARKSYKKNCRRAAHENDDFSPQGEPNVESDHTPRSDGVAVDLPGCSCDLDHEGDVASILHKKCPVITLARQQLQRLEDTDKILSENTNYHRIDFTRLWRELFLNRSNWIFALLFLIWVAFFFGLLFGAASCGSYLGQFNSPILTCLDNFLNSEMRTKIDEFRGIV